jgi:Raf kinase inhibitor-like YbhB/YbcL family protein
MTSRWLMILVLFMLIAGSALTSGSQQKAAPERSSAGQIRPPRLLLQTNAFKDADRLPLKYTCWAPDDQIVSPPFRWSHTPMGTKSFTLMLTAPQNLRRSLFVQDFLWVRWNIPASTSEIPEDVPQQGELPDGSRQVKTEQIVGYNAPCGAAGVGVLHYEFKLLALDTMLSLPSSATAEDVMKALDGHIVGASVYYGTMDGPAVKVPGVWGPVTPTIPASRP